MAVAAVQTTPEPEPLGLDDLTAGETAIAEKTAGQSITTLGNDAYGQANLIGALGWVLRRRTEPRLSFADYMKSRKLSDITRELGLVSDDEEDEEAVGKDDAGLTSSD